MSQMNEEFLFPKKLMKVLMSIELMSTVIVFELLVQRELVKGLVNSLCSLTFFFVHNHLAVCLGMVSVLVFL